MSLVVKNKKLLTFFVFFCIVVISDLIVYFLTLKSGESKLVEFNRTVIAQEEKIKKLEDETENYSQMIEEINSEIDKLNSVDIKIENEEVQEQQGNQKQARTQVEEEKNKACAEANIILSEIKDACGIMPYPGITECLKKRRLMYDRYKNGTDQSKSADKEDTEKQKEIIDKIMELEPQYMEACNKCGIEVY